jgi:carbonic anhydrase/acetyltransferase-like protein (isoleucine patch superfamily)
LEGVPIYAFGDQVPSIHPDAYVHPDAVVIGSGTIGANSSERPGAVLRGDDAEIRNGQRTSVQDNSVLHTTIEQPTVVGDDCVLGHMVHLEACTIESWCLIGVGAVVLHRVVVNSWAIVGANAVLLDDMVVPSGALAVGTPAVIKEGRARREDIEHGVEIYVERAARFREQLRRID